jgi:hypothetical protein
MFSIEESCEFTCARHVGTPGLGRSSHCRPPFRQSHCNRVECQHRVHRHWHCMCVPVRGRGYDRCRCATGRLAGSQLHFESVESDIRLAFCTGTPRARGLTWRPAAPAADLQKHAQPANASSVPIRGGRGQQPLRLDHDCGQQALPNIAMCRRQVPTPRCQWHRHCHASTSLWGTGRS